MVFVVLFPLWRQSSYKSYSLMGCPSPAVLPLFGGEARTCIRHPSFTSRFEPHGAPARCHPSPRSLSFAALTCPLPGHLALLA